MPRIVSRDGKGISSLDRRDVLKRGASLAGAVALPGGVISNAIAATSTTLVIAAPATPQSLDCNFDVSLGTFEAIAALYDNLLEFKKIPDPKQPGASREDIADHPDMPAGIAVQGKLAESFELDPAGKFIRFQLRQGIKSNWGNELTAEDVKWTWDRKFGLGAIGAFYLSTLGLGNKEGVKVEGKYTVSINRRGKERDTLIALRGSVSLRCLKPLEVESEIQDDCANSWGCGGGSSQKALRTNQSRRYTESKSRRITFKSMNVYIERQAATGRFAMIEA
jgi:hypothetical protein